MPCRHLYFIYVCVYTAHTFHKATILPTGVSECVISQDLSAWVIQHDRIYSCMKSGFVSLEKDTQDGFLLVSSTFDFIISGVTFLYKKSTLLPLSVYAPLIIFILVKSGSNSFFCPPHPHTHTHTHKIVVIFFPLYVCCHSVTGASGCSLSLVLLLMSLGTLSWIPLLLSADVISSTTAVSRYTVSLFISTTAITRYAVTVTIVHYVCN